MAIISWVAARVKHARTCLIVITRPKTGFKILLKVTEFCHSLHRWLMSIFYVLRKSLNVPAGARACCHMANSASDTSEVDVV